MKTHCEGITKNGTSFQSSSKDWLSRVEMIEADFNTMKAEIEGETSNSIGLPLKLL